MTVTANRPVPGQLILAAGMILISALPVAAFELASIGASGPGYSASTLPGLAVGLLLGVASVQVFRCRYWAFVVSLPLLLAMASLGYGIQSDLAAGLWAAGYWGIVVGLIVGQRRYFR